MVVPLKIQLIRNGVDELTHVKRFGRRGWNQLVREALTMAARMWPLRFLPLHFLPGAAQRYKYQRRSARTEIRKHRFAKRGSMPVRLDQNRWVVRRGSYRPQPLFWTGDMRDRLLSKVYEPKAIATKNRQRVSIKIPLGHPVHQYVANEVSRLTPAELQEMMNIATAYMVRSVTEHGPDSILES
jgi:hypothetical protein